MKPFEELDILPDYNGSIETLEQSLPFMDTSSVLAQNQATISINNENSLIKETSEEQDITKPFRIVFRGELVYD